MPSVLPRDERLVVFITGASSGLGRALAEDYANRPGSRLDSLEDQINKKRYRVFAGVRNLDSVRNLSPFVERVKIDVNDGDSVKTAVDDIIREAGKIDVLINNAGVNSATGATVEIDLDRVRATFETNYFGLLRVTQAVSAHMIPRRKGTIINIGSVSAYVNLPFSAAYTNSKAAVHSLNDVLRSELSPFHIRVLLIAPGSVKSSFGDNATKGIQYPSESSPYAGAKQAIHSRAVLSQETSPTDAKVFAKWIRKEGEKSPWRQRHYLTAGTRSWLAWFISYLPPFMRDFLIWRVCRLGTIQR